MFIAFEAGEGAGKSTQARLLKAHLDQAGIPAILTREPGGSPLAEELRAFVVQGDPDRMDALTELLIFTAARRDHVLRTIQPALDEGKVVICDRFIGSTYALQGAAGVSTQSIDAVHAAAGITLRPDLTIHMEVNATSALKRGMDRLATEASAEGRFEEKGVLFHQEVVLRFSEMARTLYGWETVDGNGSIEEVSERIWALVSSHSQFPRLARAS